MLMVLRSVLFNVLFFGLSFMFCFCLLWALLLPRKQAMIVIRGYFKGVYWLERIVLGLDFRLEGIENIPQEGAFIVASKHQSAHETMLFPIILNDPAIILKQGLMQIPLWGWYARKAEMIGVDRSGFSKALKSMVAGAKRVVAAGRPIIIFPQGTRTPPHANTTDKPYKSGIAKIYTEANVPVVPLALNTGFFWGRNKFLKRSGTATLRFLPPIPAGLDGKDMLRQIEAVIEPHSEELMIAAEAQYERETARRGLMDIVAFFVFLGGFWALYWNWCANAVEHALLEMQSDVSGAVVGVSFADARTYGFPFAIHVDVRDLQILSPAAAVHIPSLRASTVPLPGRSVHLRTEAPMMVKMTQGREDSMTIDSLDLVASGAIAYPWQQQKGYTIESLSIRSGILTLSAQGNIEETIDEERGQIRYDGALTVTLDGYEAYMNDLIAKGVLKRTPATFIMNMVKMQSMNMAQQARAAGMELPPVADSAIMIPVSIKDNTIYAGMFRLGEIDMPYAPMASQTNTHPTQAVQPAQPIQEHPRLPAAPLDAEKLLQQHQEEQRRKEAMEQQLRDEFPDAMPAPIRDPSKPAIKPHVYTPAPPSAVQPASPKDDDSGRYDSIAPDAGGNDEQEVVHPFTQPHRRFGPPPLPASAYTDFPDSRALDENALNALSPSIGSEAQPTGVHGRIAASPPMNHDSIWQIYLGGIAEDALEEPIMLERIYPDRAPVLMPLETYRVRKTETGAR